MFETNIFLAFHGSEDDGQQSQFKYFEMSKQLFFQYALSC